MLVKEMSRKAALVGFAIGLIASPLVMAQSSIELNQDRSADPGIIGKPETHAASKPDHVAAGELNRDEGDSLDFSPSSSRASSNEKGAATRREGYSPGELNRDEGNSTDW
ncbi:hypothetical protein HZU72_05710 [Halomonas sp. QX-2]|jgi:hypothetical protein|uniref:Uncharacterized protein n=1 Tax=Vreelandella sedimenti TaxID=2729618 RepID=A0A7Z0N5E9_9GAMM|nr:MULTISPECIES: hypothetical protein [Halomonas]NYT71924.1 hypothetical protein [Halomonas sedimenti]|tara:strand:+ start:7932 stop:8261 length:330 start_codon:yes stop_codon:yes gene_type:complete